MPPINFPQSTFNAAPAAAIPGQIVDARRTLTISRVSRVDIGFAIGVIQYLSDDGKCDLPGSASDVFLGVTQYDPSLPPAQTINGVAYAGAYAASRATRILRQGAIWVLPEQDVDPTKSVFVRYAVNGGLITLGAFRTDADTSRAFQVTAARWLNTVTAASGQPAQLEVNLP